MLVLVAELARTVLDIPVPKVLAWSATDQNPVQAEFIIMEEARGSPLHEVWQDLPLRTKCDIVRQFVDIERRLLSVSFDRYDIACSGDDFPSSPTYTCFQIGVVVLQGK